MSEDCSGVSEVCCVGVEHRMSLLGLDPREKSPPAVNPDTHLSRSSLDQDTDGHRCGGGWLRTW